MNELTGRCQCGNVIFKVKQETPPISLTCHCRDCQQFTGTGHARSLGVDVDQVTWLSEGRTTSYTVESALGNTVENHFCGKCGTPVYKRALDLAEHVLFLYAGSLDRESRETFNPGVEIWLHSKPSWDCLV